MIWFTGAAHGEAVQAECVGRCGGRRQSTPEASVCDTRDCKDWARLCAGLKPDGQWLHRKYARPQMWDQNAWRLESWQGQIGLRQRRTNLRVAQGVSANFGSLAWIKKNNNGLLLLFLLIMVVLLLLFSLLGGRPTHFKNRCWLVVYAGVFNLDSVDFECE